MCSEKQSDSLNMADNPLSRNNLKVLDRAHRQQAARERGESTPETDYDLHEYNSSEDVRQGVHLPPERLEELRKEGEAQRKSGRHIDIGTKAYRKLWEECLKDGRDFWVERLQLMGVVDEDPVPERDSGLLPADQPELDEKPAVYLTEAEEEAEKKAAMEMWGINDEYLAKAREEEEERLEYQREMLAVAGYKYSMSKYGGTSDKARKNKRQRDDANDETRKSKRQRDDEQRADEQRDDEQRTADSDSPKVPLLPPNFPRYRVTQSVNEIGAYIANASYVVSLGGPPSADIKYGLIVVPVGQETLLFSGQPDNTAADDFFNSVQECRPWKPQPMHDPDKDSDEFLRRRFATSRDGSASSPDRPSSGGWPVVKRVVAGTAANAASEEPPSRSKKRLETAPVANGGLKVAEASPRPQSRGEEGRGKTAAALPDAADTYGCPPLESKRAGKKKVRAQAATPSVASDPDDMQPQPQPTTKKTPRRSLRARGGPVAEDIEPQSRARKPANPSPRTRAPRGRGKNGASKP